MSPLPRARSLALVGQLVLIGQLTLAGPALLPPPARSEPLTEARLPHYTAARLDTGAPVKLREAAAGAPVMVHLWATWCLPCLDELPIIEPLAVAAERRGLKVFSVALDPDPAKPRQLAEERDVPGLLLHDPTPEAGLAFGTDRLPATLLYDRAGRLVWSTDRAIDPKDPELRAALERILKPAKTARPTRPLPAKP